MQSFLGISDTVRLIRHGTLDPLALLDRCLDRIQQYESLVHAWVIVDEQGARRNAREVRDRLARGDDPGPLAGIPVGIKDIADVAGLPTQAGSRLRAGHRATHDAPMVAALRRAGAVILGKTVTVEFACFDPPPTRNPWHPDLQHTPGGSSSGSAVAVALGQCLGAVGSQTGGSLVRPATFCGIAAWKPGFGRISLDGFVPVAYHLDHAGLLARNAADLQTLCQAFAQTGADPSDAVAPSDLSTNPLRLGSAVRLGIVEEFFLTEANHAVRQLTATAIERLRQAGAKIQSAPLPAGFADVHRMHRRIMAVEAAAYHRQNFLADRDAYGPKISALLEEGMAVPAIDYADALAHQREFRRHAATALGPWDALVMPATDTTAPPSLASTGDARFQLPWSYAGTPVVSIPSGLAADGLPAALQFVQAPGGEETLLGVARWCEERLDFCQLPPLVG